MRYKSEKSQGFTIYAVAGTTTVSFAIDFEPKSIEGLLGFAVERQDLQTNEKQILTGFKVFRQLVPTPTPTTVISTMEHPIQSFVWDDTTCKDNCKYQYTFYAMHGTPRALKKSKPIQLNVTTEPSFSEQTHDIFFNRGTASQQAYISRYGKRHPLLLKEPQKTEALNWMGRDLRTGLFNFISQAQKGDALRCCFYEFSYVPVLEALKKAIAAGVDVKVILDLKNADNPKAEPRAETLEAIHKADFPMENVIERSANPKDLNHNKYMIFIEKGNPKSVWTGSTNISFAGIHGHSNVGHWVRNTTVASQYLRYWELLKTNPGGLPTDKEEVQKQKFAAYQKQIDAIQPALKPTEWNKIPAGTTAVFSPQSDVTTLKCYAQLLDNAKDMACITLPFGINNKTLHDIFLDNTADNAIIFMLFDTEPKDLKFGEKNNIYIAWGVDTEAALSDNPANKAMPRLNSNVEFIHTKILLMDPLSADPIVVSGSGNFTNKSVMNNDENMLVIRGDKRVADIYLTEFNRLYSQFYMNRVLMQLSAEEKQAGIQDALFLDETDNWTKKYAAGSLRLKRLKAFTKMGM